MADEITVSGTSFLRGGELWYPRGFNCLGLLAPDWCEDPTSNGAKAVFSPETRAVWRSQGANLLRWQISQKGVTDSTLDDATRQRYVDFVVAGIRAVRAEGWNCIVSCQDQKHGCGPAASTPSPRTTLFWQTLAPYFVDDAGVMFEAFNEPRTNTSQQARWRGGGGTNNVGETRVGHQALLDTIRETGAKNVVLVDGGSFAKTLEGTTTLTDPLNNCAYAIHPYDYDKLGGPSAWDTPYTAAPAAAHSRHGVELLHQQGQHGRRDAGSDPADLSP